MMFRRQTLPLDYDHALDEWKYLWSDLKWSDLSYHLFGSLWSIVTYWPWATLQPSSLWTSVLCPWSLRTFLSWAPHIPSVLIRRYRKRVFSVNQKVILPPRSALVPAWALAQHSPLCLTFFRGKSGKEVEVQEPPGRPGANLSGHWTSQRTPSPQFMSNLQNRTHHDSLASFMRWL